MGIFLYSLIVVLGVATIAADITAFFLLVRLLRRWRPWKPLVAFDHIGTPLVQYVTTQADRVWRRVSPRHYLSNRDRLLLALGLVCVIRLLIGLPLAMLVSG